MSSILTPQQLSNIGLTPEATDEQVHKTLTSSMSPFKVNGPAQPSLEKTPKFHPLRVPMAKPVKMLKVSSRGTHHLSSRPRLSLKQHVRGLRQRLAKIGTKTPK